MGAFGRHIIAVATMYGDYGRGGSYVPEPKTESEKIQTGIDMGNRSLLKRLFLISS